MKKLLLLVFLSAVFLPYVSEAASELFYPYVVFPTGSWPDAVEIGDVNGDGRNDVVMGTASFGDPINDHRLFVFLRNERGKLDPPIKYQTTSEVSHKSISVGDMNYDGLTDVVVGNSGADIQIFLQNALGGLDSPTVYATADSKSIKISDLNNDGRLDVVGIGRDTNTVSVFFQNAGGSLDSPVVYGVTYDGYEEVDVGDVNHDGLNDVIVMSGQGNIGVLLQQPGGTFAAASYCEPGGGDETRGVAVGDINGDTRQDIVVTYGRSPPYSKIGVFLQNGSDTL